MKHQDAQKESGIYLSPDVNYGPLPSVIDSLLSEKRESLRQHNQHFKLNGCSCELWPLICFPHNMFHQQSCRSIQMLWKQFMKL